MQAFPPSLRATVIELKSRTDLNGEAVHVVRFVLAKARYQCTVVSTGEVIALKKANMVPQLVFCPLLGTLEGVSSCFDPEEITSLGTTCGIHMRCRLDGLQVLVICPEVASRPFVGIRAILDIGECDDSRVEQAAALQEMGLHLLEADQNASLAAYHLIAGLLQLQVVQSAQAAMPKELLTFAILNDLGRAYHEMGDYCYAAQFLTKVIETSSVSAFDVVHNPNFRNLFYFPLSELGRVYEALGYYSESEICFKKCYRETADPDQLDHLAILYTSLGRFDEALSSVKEALSTGSIEQKGKYLGTAGGVCLSLKQHSEALEYYQAALQLSIENKDPLSESTDYGDIGSVYLEQGRYQDAILHFSKALQICQSQPSYNQAKACTHLHNLGTAHRISQDCDRAFEYYHQAQKAADTAETKAACLGSLGELYFQNKDYANAIKMLKAGHEQNEEVWSRLCTEHDQIVFGDKQNNVNTAHVLQHAYCKMDQPALGLVWSEMVRARALQLTLQKQHRGLLAVAMEDSPNGVHITFEDDAFNPSAVLTQIQKPNVNEPTIALDWPALQEISIQQSACILVYSHVRVDTLLIWILGSQGCEEPILREVAVTDQSLAELVEHTRSLLGARSSVPSSVESKPPASEDEDKLKHLLQKCYSLLIEPVADVLLEESDLIIFPDQELYALPFAALMDAESQHLIQRFSVSVAPSFGTLAELEKCKRTKSMTDKLKVLAVGDPDFGGWSLPDGNCLPKLKGAREEVRGVLDLFEEVKSVAHDVECIVGTKANKAAVTSLMETADIIHLATHGTPNGMYFAGDNCVQATLTMAEVQRLELSNAKLVVLSGCDTFLSDRTAPLHAKDTDLDPLLHRWARSASTDGVVGITRAFMAAKALTVVSSLWKISDNDTKNLIDMFYRLLITPESPTHLDIPRALQAAMKNMISKKRPVASWAPFVVYGLASWSMENIRKHPRSVASDGFADFQENVQDIDAECSGCRLEMMRQYLQTGDPCYLNSVALRAAKVEFIHPFTGERMPPDTTEYPKFRKADWNTLCLMMDNGEGKVWCSKYFYCKPGPSREFWIHLDPTKVFNHLNTRAVHVVIHIHYAGTHVTPEFTRATSANARFSVLSQLVEPNLELKGKHESTVTHQRIPMNGVNLTQTHRHSNPGPCCMGECWQHTKDRIPVTRTDKSDFVWDVDVETRLKALAVHLPAPLDSRITVEADPKNPKVAILVVDYTSLPPAPHGAMHPLPTAALWNTGRQIFTVQESTGTFGVEDTITGSTSGATCIVASRVSAKVLQVSRVSESFAAKEHITASPSGATGSYYCAQGEFKICTTESHRKQFMRHLELKGKRGWDYVNDSESYPPYPTGLQPEAPIAEAKDLSKLLMGLENYRLESRPLNITSPVLGVSEHEQAFLNQGAVGEGLMDQNGAEQYALHRGCGVPLCSMHRFACANN